MAEGCVTGSRIKLISKAHIRYEGKLSKVDPVANTVTLDEVRMFGTEGRETNGQQQIPGAPDKVYAQIVFKGSDIAQLSVVKQPLPDPAVVSYSSEPQHAAKTHVTAMQPSHDNTPRVAQMFDRFASEQRPHNNNYSYNGGISHGKGFDGGKRGHDGGYNGRGSFGGGYGGDLGKGGGGGGGGGGFKGGKRGYGGGHHHGGGKGRGGGGYGKGTRGGMKGGRDSGHTGMNFKVWRIVCFRVWFDENVGQFQKLSMQYNTTQHNSSPTTSRRTTTGRNLETTSTSMKWLQPLRSFLPTRCQKQKMQSRYAPLAITTRQGAHTQG